MTATFLALRALSSLVLFCEACRQIICDAALLCRCFLCATAFAALVSPFAVLLFLLLPRLRQPLLLALRLFSIRCCSVHGMPACGLCSLSCLRRGVSACAAAAFAATLSRLAARSRFYLCPFFGCHDSDSLALQHLIAGMVLFCEPLPADRASRATRVSTPAAFEALTGRRRWRFYLCRAAQPVSASCFSASDFDSPGAAGSAAFLSASATAFSASTFRGLSRGVSACALQRLRQPLLGGVFQHPLCGHDAFVGARTRAATPSPPLLLRPWFHPSLLLLPYLPQHAHKRHSFCKLLFSILADGMGRPLRGLCAPLPASRRRQERRQAFEALLSPYRRFHLRCRSVFCSLRFCKLASIRFDGMGCVCGLRGLSSASLPLPSPPLFLGLALPSPLPLLSLPRLRQPLLVQAAFQHPVCWRGLRLWSPRPFCPLATAF